MADLRLIPRILHQTWRDDDVPSTLAAYQASWRRLNPDWEYRFWTDQTSRAFIAEHYPQLIPVFDDYQQPIKRVDLARYVWMYHFGGVYADLDLEPIRSLNELLIDAPFSLAMGLEPVEHCREHERELIVSNALIIAEQRHPAWTEVFDWLIARRDWVDPLSATGPFLLSDLYRHSAEFRAALHLLDPIVVNPMSKAQVWAVDSIGPPIDAATLDSRVLAVHHFVGTWWRDASAPHPGSVAADALHDSDRYSVISMFRRTVSSVPHLKKLLRVGGKDEAPLAFGVELGQLCPDVMFYELRDGAGRRYWSKKWENARTMLEPTTRAIEAFLRRLDRSDLCLSVDYSPTLGMIYPYAEPLFDCAGVVHYWNRSEYFTPAECAQIEQLGSTLVEVDGIPLAPLHVVADFQIARINSQLVYLDFEPWPKRIDLAPVDAGPMGHGMYDST